MIAAVSVLHNEATGTFHPILFRDAPLPGAYNPAAPPRVKSIGHHTAGFPTLADAAATVRADERVRGAVIDVEHVIAWDGEGVPASVAFIEGGRVVSAFGD